MADEKTKVAEVVETTPAAVATAEERRAAVQEEYSTWVAAGPIDHDGVRAYNTGDPVPASNVAAHKYDEQGWVVKRSTKAGGEAIAQSQVPSGRA
jgi:hypothetical protein